ncbi:hypothetical protein [Spiribacter roseus]|uniref:hypothetical protein n=1 Tax=Spiribacter roseus TaxID=1855875 RepID=UPI00133102A6|nr:hypothetical protein [Spiribacter roseus]
MTSNVRAGRIEELIKPGQDTTNPDIPPWVIVDVGFSSCVRSSGITINGGEIPDPIQGYRSASSTPKRPGDKHFGMLCPAILGWLNAHQSSGKTGVLNLMLEAPLSMAFAKRSTPGDEPQRVIQGNPIARVPDEIEVTESNAMVGKQQRPWHAQPASGLMIASMRLIQELSTALEDWEIRLFEGFVSFKTVAGNGGHWEDTCKLWDALPTRPAVLADRDGPIINPQQGLVTSITSLMDGASDGNIPPILRVIGSGDAELFSEERRV